MKVSIASLQGKRPSNEDAETVFLNLDGKDKNKAKINLFGVFDGHGGKLISKFASENLLHYFTKIDQSFLIDTEYTIKKINKIFKDFTEEILKEHPKAAYTSGSTCCLAVIINDGKSNLLWIINLGDSRAILHNKKNQAIQLSVDHKPNIPTERERIEKLGGKDKLYYDGSDWRIVDLSLSRALGDMHAHPYVSHLPQVYRYRLHPLDKTLIIACDGLWDVMSNQQVVDFVDKNLNQNNPAKLLAEEALKRGSGDNVSTIIVKLIN